MPNINRQLRIHIEQPNGEYDEESNLENNKKNHNSNTYNLTNSSDVRPISNRNMIQKINTMNSIEMNMNIPIEKNITPKDIFKSLSYNSDYKVSIKKFLEKGYIQLLIITVTTWAIFGDDIRLLSMSPTVDEGFSILNWIIMSIFILEYILTILSDNKYIFTVFSALDILSIVSMIPMENLADAAKNIIFLNADGGTVARTGRAAKVGAKAGRIVKAARFLRLGRLVMEAIDTKEVQRDFKRRSSVVNDTIIKRQETLDERPANCLSHRLSKELTVKVVIIIFLLLVVYPFLGVHTEPFEDRTTILTMINEGCMECSDKSYMDNLISRVTKNSELFYMKACGYEYKSYDSNNPKRISWINFYAQGYISNEISPSNYYTIKTEICKDIHGLHYGSKCVEALLGKNIHILSNVTAGFYDSDLYQEESLMSLYFLLFVLGLLITSSFVISKDTDKISRLISDPLQEICVKMKKMQEFSFYDDKKEIKSEIHEINQLNDSFSRLQTAVISFSRYVPLEIVKNLMKSKKQASINVERRELSIFFSDIKGFTTICEKLKPSEILTLLTEYFDAMEEIVSDTTGTILEYVGDAILAVWNAPTEISDHAEKSIHCALKMQIKLAKLRKKWISQGLPKVYIRVGVNTGEVFHGNLGSHNRLKYGVLGDSVNLASRLEELNKRYGTELLVTNDTYKKGDVSKLYLARPVDIVVVKGKSIPTLLWEIVGIKENASIEEKRICELQKLGMNLFLQQEFKEACNSFSEADILEIQHKQKYNGESEIRFMYDTTQHIHNRCKLLLGSPKMKDFDGSETLNEKHF